MLSTRETIDLLRDNWRKNHRHHGGAAAVFRCCAGMRKLRRMEPAPERKGDDAVDCVTFSVVPNLTAFWSKMMSRAIPGGRARVWVGDCSGGFGAVRAVAPDVRFYPMINYLQGVKLDLFLEKFLRSEFFVVSDDDVIWLSQHPWNWAMEEFAREPKTAVVSLVPRLRFQWELKGGHYQPMGSYCLIVRRSAWLQERLSFLAVPKPSPSSGSYGGLYDTCDFANVALIERGYRVAIAPPDVAQHLAGFKGISSAILRIQKDPPQGYAAAFGDGPEPILETCLVARALKPLILAGAPKAYNAELTDPELMERAYQAMLPLVTPGRRAEIEARVANLVGKIAESLAFVPSPAQAAVS